MFWGEAEGGDSKKGNVAKKFIKTSLERLAHRGSLAGHGAGVQERCCHQGTALPGDVRPWLLLACVTHFQDLRNLSPRGLIKVKS